MLVALALHKAIGNQPVDEGGDVGFCDAQAAGDLADVHGAIVVEHGHDLHMRQRHAELALNHIHVQKPFAENGQSKKQVLGDTVDQALVWHVLARHISTS